MRWSIRLLLACCMISTALAQNNPTVALDTNGTLTWTNLFTNGLLNIERSTNLNSDVWLPFCNILTSNENTSGSISIPLTNVPVFYRARIADTSTNPPGMKLVPSGYFLMGDTYSVSGSNNDERPAHIVYVSSFFIDQFEFTNQRLSDLYQWAYNRGRIYVTYANGIPSVVKVTNYNTILLDLQQLNQPTNSTRYWSGIQFNGGVFSPVPGRENEPCIDISWFGAAFACNILSEIEGLAPCFDITTTNYPCDFTRNGYRLPTEAEWEKAARGGMTGQHFPWASYGTTSNPNYYTNFITTNMANFTQIGETHPFNMKPVGFYNGNQSTNGTNMINGYGLYDTAGNAREWCYDWYLSVWYSLLEASLPDPIGPSGGSTNRCVRGGSFDLHPVNLRVSDRDYQPPSVSTAASWYHGFRIVRRP